MRSVPSPIIPFAFAFAVGLVASLAFAPVALATTRYVSPSGSDVNTGLSPSQAWLTISKANTAAQPGDVIVIANGTYSHFPAPVIDGTPAARITYVGNIGSPGSVVVLSGGTLVRSHVTIKGFRLAGGFTLSGVRDSIADCEVLGSRPMIKAADDCVLARLRIDASRFWVVGAESDTFPVAERDTMVDCTVNLASTGTSGHTVRLKAIRDCVFDRNRWTITVGADAVGATAFKLFFVRGCKFRDSYWNITNNCVGACDEAGWFMQRDMTQSNTWARDTILMGGPGEVQFFGSGAGSFPGSTMNSNYDRVIVKMIGTPAYGAAMYYQDAARWDTLTNCVFVGSRTGLGFGQIVYGNVLVDHCVSVGFAPGIGALGADLGGTQVMNGTLVLRNNIYYTARSAARSPRSSPLYLPVAAVRGHIVANHNLFFGPMGRDSAVNMSSFSAVGVGKPWTVQTGADSNSVWGSPQFVDTSSVQNFDARLRAGSAAIGAGLGGSDAGAFPFSTPGSDVTPPANVSNLAVNAAADSSVILGWTATGDDGNSGVATAYDLRWSTSPIDAGNFTSATPVTVAPAPQPGGTPQLYVVLGLRPTTSYWFALRARDEAGNWSGLSNVATATTATVDQQAPATIFDLSATP